MRDLDLNEVSCVAGGTEPPKTPPSIGSGSGGVVGRLGRAADAIVETANNLIDSKVENFDRLMDAAFGDNGPEGNGVDCDPGQDLVAGPDGSSCITPGGGG